VLPSVFTELEGVVEATESFVQRHCQDDEFVYKVVLLASEAVTNAIEHGNELNPEKTVRVDLVAKETHIELWVEDQGSGFQRKEVPNPLDSDHLLDDGGRGIYLMESLADEIRYEQDGRRIGLMFKLPS
jgi:serine/threonine-protein kinase RsbW